MTVPEYVKKIRAAIEAAKSQHGDDAPKKECVLPLASMESILDFYEGRIATVTKSRDAAIAACALMKKPKDRGPMNDLFEDMLGGAFGKKRT